MSSNPFHQFLLNNELMNFFPFAIELPNQISHNTHNDQSYVDPIVFQKLETLVLINSNLLLFLRQQRLLPQPVKK